ncbi:MAG: response regulator [Candidatus Desulfofervidaceae bacterium]|nr:response regulator [Candidatus Desulfofervidaceae bacterium]
MFPLSLLVGLFICVAIPSSYYFIRTEDLKKQAAVHADYLASIFKEVVETTPETWEKGIKSYISRTNIAFVKIFDRNHNLVSEISSASFSRPSSLVTAEREALYAGKTYAFVLVGISLKETKAETFRLLVYSSLAGTFIGIFLFLLPVLEIYQVEEKVNESRQQLLEEQEKLKFSEEKYRALFEFAPDGIVISTTSGRIVSWNQSFLDMFNLDKKKIPQLNMENLYANPKTRNKIMAELHKQGYVQNKEIVLKRTDGTEMPALVSLKLISCRLIADEVCTEDNHQMLIENIIRDISEQKKIEQQLIQAQKMESIGVLAGGVAHDFNNLLAGILGYANLIKVEVSEDTSLYRYAEVIERSATRASELTQKLLAFARGGKYKVEVINLNEIVEEVVALLSRTIEKTIAIHRELASDLFLVEVDPSQMTQTLLNICINSRDAMPNGGTLTIKTFNTYLEERFFPTGDRSRPGNYVAVSVSDTGTGIDEATKQRIFEPFFTTKEKGKGTGLGLSMVYGIVRNHDGYIDVKSRLGQGTTFIIYLPAAEKKEQRQIEKEEVEILGGSETILLIDDEEVVRNLVKDILEGNGYKVLLAKDGEEGLSVYQACKDQINLVLLDMIMPKKSGTEVFKTLKSVNPNVKVLLVTGYSLNEQAQAILHNGALGFIQKPYQVKELLKTIRKVLDKK